MTCCPPQDLAQSFNEAEEFISNSEYKFVKIRVIELFSFCQDKPSTWQVCHIKMQIKQHDYCAGVPSAGHNKKATRKSAVLSRYTMPQMSRVLKGACSWHAGCRSVHQSCPPWIEWSFQSRFWLYQPRIVERVWRCVMGRHKLRLMNTGAFYWLQSECTATSWGPLLCHSSAAVTSCCKDLRTIPASWKRSCMACILATSLSTFGMLWIDAHGSVLQFLPTSSSFTQPLKKSGATGHSQPDQLHCMSQMQ